MTRCFPAIAGMVFFVVILASPGRVQAQNAGENKEKPEFNFDRGSSAETAQAFLSCLRSGFGKYGEEYREDCERCFFITHAATERFFEDQQKMYEAGWSKYALALYFREMVKSDLKFLPREKEGIQDMLFRARFNLNTIFLEMGRVTAVEDSLWTDTKGRERATIKVTMEGPDMRLGSDSRGYWNVYRKTFWLRNLLMKEGQWMFSPEPIQTKSEMGQDIVDPLTGYDARRAG